MKHKMNNQSILPLNLNVSFGLTFRLSKRKMLFVSEEQGKSTLWLRYQYFFRSFARARICFFLFAYSFYVCTLSLPVFLMHRLNGDGDITNNFIAGIWYFYLKNTYYILVCRMRTKNGSS